MGYRTVYPSTTLYPSESLYPFELSYEILIYDRTMADIEYRNQVKAKIINHTATQSEQNEWRDAILKGTYNYNDMNRVGAMLDYVKDRGSERGFSITYPYPRISDYDMDSEPDVTAIQKLLSNVAVIKNTFQAYISTQVPSDIWSLNNANAIESILYQTKAIFEGIEMSTRYSDEVYSGGSY